MTDTREATPRPWARESDLPHGDRPRMYGADGRLVAVFGNAEGDQDRWEADAALAERAVNHFDEVREQLANLIGHARFVAANFDIHYAHIREADALYSKLEASHGSA